MDQDEGIRTLLRWFGYQRFRIEEITTEERVREIARLVGADTLTLHGTRTQLGKRLTAMSGYRCSTAPNLGATLIVIEVAEDSRPGVYQFQHR